LVCSRCDQIRNAAATPGGEAGPRLESLEYEVVAAPNGLVAMDRLRQGTRPDAILLDLMMPVMDGYQLLLELRKNATLASIPVVVITAAGNARVEAEKLGVAGHLQKPFKVDELLAMIERIRGSAAR
jgi:CheY-like chemotaxis protein